MKRATRSLAALVATVLLGAAPTIFPQADELPSHPGLPDPLVAFNGKPVATAEQWTHSRRKELKTLFEHYMYGVAPDSGKVVVSVERTDVRSIGGKATTKEIAIAVGPQGALTIHLLVVVPNKRTGPVPVFLGTNFHGNHTTMNDPAIRLSTAWMPDRAPATKDHRATDAARGTDAGVWSIEESIDRGYAVATFYCGDVAPDHPGLADGVFPLYGKTGPNDWGAVAAWAWGLSRAVDYLVTDADLDRSKIAVVGHSRLGKAAIVAGAFDDRIALTIPHQAGCGGTAPSRGTVGESAKQINDRFPHWFCSEFKSFNDHTDRLPFDQNCLIALVAPRPVLLTNAVDDQWANPTGQFEALKAADPVYRLLGVEGLGAKGMPEVGVLVDTRLGYHIRAGKHSMGLEDWRVWWTFADKHFGRAGTK
jgi:hypothetical protein